MSNEHQSQEERKTKWELRRFVVSASLVIAVILYVGLFVDRESICTEIGSNCYYLDKATDSKSRAKGLSGVASLPENEGIIFYFPQDDTHCMWMKDMNFAIDIIWLDQGGEVVDIAHQVQPETFPDRFCSQEEARYVVELNGGEINGSELNIGDRIMLN